MDAEWSESAFGEPHAPPLIVSGQVDVLPAERREVLQQFGIEHLAEMERELTIERTRAGLEVARQLGRKGDRKRQMTDSKIKSAKKLLVSAVPPRDVAGNLGVSVPTLYRWIPAST